MAAEPRRGLRGRLRRGEVGRRRRGCLDVGFGGCHGLPCLGVWWSPPAIAASPDESDEAPSYDASRGETPARGHPADPASARPAGPAAACQVGSGVSQGIRADTQWVIGSAWSLLWRCRGGWAKVLVGPAAEHDAALLLGHGGDERAGVLGERLAGHAPADGHHHVDHEVRVVVDGGVAVHLQVAERPALVEHAEADLGVAGDRPWPCRGRAWSRPAARRCRSARSTRPTSPGRRRGALSRTRRCGGCGRTRVARTGACPGRSAA